MKTNRMLKLAVLTTAGIGALSSATMLSAQTALPVAPTAGADQGQSSDDTGIRDIIVTAERRETSLQRTAVAVSALDSTALKENRVSDVRDLASFVPNIAISANSGLEFPIAIRGISSSIGGIGADSPTAVYLDGVYIARPFGTVFDFADTERVEVLRGPQGTLYGRNSTAGAISVISRKPTDTPTADISVEAGSYSLIHAKAAVRGPIVGDTILASVSGSYKYRHGFYTNITTGETHVNPDNAWQLGSTISFNPQGKLRFDLRGDISRIVINAASKELSGIFGDPVNLPGTANIVTANHPGTSYARTGGISGTITYDLDWAVLKSITAFRFEKTETTNDVDAASISFARIAIGPEKEHQLSQEIQLSSSNWDHGSYVLGVYAFGEKSRTQVVFEQFDTPTEFGPVDLFINNTSKIRDRNVAAFGQLDYKPLDDVTITLGARYTWEKKNFDFGQGLVFAPAAAVKPPEIDVVPTLPNGLNIHQHATYKAFTPKFGVSWQATRNIFAYVNAQRGFKSGGFSFADGNAPGFGPEKIWAYEAGVKTSLFDNHLRTNLTGFYYTYSNLQVSLPGGAGQRFTANAADSTIKGIELEVTAQPVRGLKFSGFGSLLDAKYKNYLQDLTAQNAATPPVPLFISCPGGRLLNGIQTCDLSGNHLSRAPKWSYTLSASYEIKAQNFSLTPQVTWHREANSFYSEQNVAPAETGGVKNLSARITLAVGDNLTFAVYGDNLTNYRYISGAVAVPPAVAGFINWPRTFGGELTFRY
jgi:iron complex outermembrane recepter protein